MVAAVSIQEFEPEKTFQDYLAVVQRRWKIGLFTFGLLLLPAVLVAVLWPPTYRSTATILIEQQEIPQDLVRTTITSFADQRIELISQRVMTTTNLLEIIREHNLYSDDFDTVPREVIIERMRGDIARNMISADVVDPRSGRPTAATIAFTVGFDSRSPQLAARVANEITSLYLQENSQTRREQAADTSSFLASEAARLSEEIAILESRLADFKQDNVNQLPELAQLNMQLFERTETEINDIRRQQAMLDERRIYLESELAQISPSRSYVDSNGELVLAPRERLRGLQAELASMQGVYSDLHPAVLRTRRALAALEAEIGISVDALDSEPEVADNPVYVQLRTQLNAAAAQALDLQQREVEMQARLLDLEQRLTQTPIIERDYYALTRDLDSARARYQEIRFGERSAQTAENLEADAKGERFTLIEPPLVPQQPISPNRSIVMFLGLLVAGGVAVALMAVLELFDRSIHNPFELGRITQAPPLGIIPKVVTAADRGRSRRRLIYFVLSGLVACMVLLSVVHFFVMPLDGVWFGVMRRLGL